MPRKWKTNLSTWYYVLIINKFKKIIKTKLIRVLCSMRNWTSTGSNCRQCNRGGGGKVGCQSLWFPNTSWWQIKLHPVEINACVGFYVIIAKTDWGKTVHKSNINRLSQLYNMWCVLFVSLFVRCSNGIGLYVLNDNNGHLCSAGIDQFWSSWTLLLPLSLGHLFHSLNNVSSLGIIQSVLPSMLRTKQSVT